MEEENEEEKEDSSDVEQEPKEMTAPHTRPPFSTLYSDFMSPHDLFSFSLPLAAPTPSFSRIFG